MSYLRCLRWIVPVAYEVPRHNVNSKYSVVTATEDDRLNLVWIDILDFFINMMKQRVLLDSPINENGLMEGFTYGNGYNRTNLHDVINAI